MNSSEGNTKSSPNKNAGEEGANNSEVESHSIDGVFSALELFALVFWILSEKINSHWIVHSLLLSIAALCFLCGGAHLLNKKFNLPGLIWSLCGLAGSAVAFLIFLNSFGDVTQKPRLIFAFFPNGKHEHALEFTNDFFLMKRGNFKTSQVRGVLLMPLSPGQSNADLSFGLIKDNEKILEFAELQIEGDAEIGFSKGWTKIQSATSFPSSAMMEYNRKTIGRFRAPFPDLHFAQVNQTNRSIMAAHVISEGFESTDLVFWLVFSAKIKAPHLAEAELRWRGKDFTLDIPNPELPQ